MALIPPETSTDILTGQATCPPRLPLLQLWGEGVWQVKGFPDETFVRLSDALAAAERLHPDNQEGTVNTTAVQDRLTLTLTEVKKRLNVLESSRDEEISELITASKQAADLYLNNPFLDATGTETDIPEMVKLGCVKWIDVALTGGPFGVLEEKAGTLSRRYKNDPVAGASIYWQPLRLAVGY